MVVLVITEELKPFERAIYNESDQVLLLPVPDNAHAVDWARTRLVVCIAPSVHSNSFCLPCYNGHNVFCSNLSHPSLSKLPIGKLTKYLTNFDAVAVLSLHDSQASPRTMHHVCNVMLSPPSLKNQYYGLLPINSCVTCVIRCTGLLQPNSMPSVYSAIHPCEALTV